MEVLGFFLKVRLDLDVDVLDQSSEADGLVLVHSEDLFWVVESVIALRSHGLQNSLSPEFLFFFTFLLNFRKLGGAVSIIPIEEL